MRDAIRRFVHPAVSSSVSSGLALLALVLAVSVGRGCSCNPNTIGGGGDGGGDAGISGGALVVTPAEVTLNAVAGAAPPTQAYTVKTGDGTDVTAQSSFSLADMGLGTFAGNTLSASTSRGGTTRVTATFQQQTGFATVHVVLHASVTDGCPGCPPFPKDGTPPCAAGRNPVVLYPPDKTLLPPNTNVIDTQFDQATGNTLFEIDYENQLTDVRVETRCSAIADSRGLMTNGCGYDLTQAVWDYLAQTNRGGAPVTITVRATDDTGKCVATSAARTIRFATNDVVGGLYYWQSVVLGGVQGKSGGIFRYDYGARGQTPETYLSPTQNINKCIGCHFLSRDGLKMTYGSDDADADDEYGDLHSIAIDVAMKTTQGNTLSPGFQAFSPDHKFVLVSDGEGRSTPPSFGLFDGVTGMAATPAQVPTGTARGTQPDWSADGSTVVFVQASNFLAPLKDDDHFTGGSLFTLSYANNAFGMPKALLTSAGENNYYPAFSPDSAYVIFNRVPATGMPLAQDGFSNVNARVMMMPARAGAQPVDLPALNDTGAYTNSWPRFNPLVQMEGGHKLVWVTFSSTRDYGVRVRNSNQVDNSMGTLVDQRNCYPPESPENLNGTKNDPLPIECHQPQIWMAAIDLTTADGGGADPSYPAFWLPFQSVTSHNHIAQWVVQIVGPTSPDGGTCIQLGDTCKAGDICCGGICSGNTCALP